MYSIYGSTSDARAKTGFEVTTDFNNQGFDDKIIPIPAEDFLF